MIEIGEYVRTKRGDIAIFQGYNNNPKSHWTCKIELQNIKTWKYCTEDYIKKHSKNIIDLIEVGDYVNGKYVKEINQYKDAKSIIALIGIIDEDDIKSIVTKEQFSNTEYRLEE